MRIAVIACLLVLVAAATLPVSAGGAAANQAEDLLGDAFESTSAGITFRPPAGCREIAKGPGDAEIAEFVDEQAKWDLKVAMWTTDQPVPLQTPTDKSGVTGLMESTIQQTRTADPGVKVLRNDVTNIAQAKVGMLVFAYTIGTDKRLTQIALIQKSQYLYYIFNLTTPGVAKDAAQGDADEQRAVATFGGMLDSVKLLDRSKIRQDQVDRLFRTRALFTTWTAARIKTKLAPQQWLRVIRDGKDVGYSYIVERPERRGDADGILIGIRSRMLDEGGGRVDSESWFYSNIDRKHASWTTAVRVSDDKGKLLTYGTEIGADDVTVDGHRLTVKTIRKSSDTEPVQRDLPPWYLPQAFSELLPRLLPLNEPKTYMFASYVSNKREVMSRYVEVLPRATVRFNGREVEAVQVHDRYGLDGPITTDYFSPAGAFLGSRAVSEKTVSQGVTRPSELLIVPVTKEQLLKIWTHADLSEPSLPSGGGIGR